MCASWIELAAKTIADVPVVHIRLGKKGLQGHRVTVLKLLQANLRNVIIYRIRYEV